MTRRLTLNVHFCVCLWEKIRDNTQTVQSRQTCVIVHTMSLSVPSRQSISKHIGQTVINRCSLVPCSCIGEREVCLSVSCGWGWVRAREWGVRLLGFLVTAAWAHLIPLQSPMQPSSPYELCVKGGLSAILASAPCHSLNQPSSL